jgi:hypothetical protein
MAYKIRYAQLWNKCGFCGAGSAAVDSETVQLSGRRVHGHLLTVLLFPVALGMNEFIGMSSGVQRRPIVLAVTCAAALGILYFLKKSFFSASLSVEKRLITDVERSGQKISLLLPDDTGLPVRFVLKAETEEEAISLETELK